MITRKTILIQIGEHLTSMNQWALYENYDYASKYANKAESLIELLEVYDCGSVGGYDEGQHELMPHASLHQRYSWLYNKK